MRLLTLPVTIARVPIELGLGAAKGAVKFAQGLVGGGEETVAEEPRAKPAPRRKPARRSANGRSGTTASRAPGSRASGSRRTASRASTTRPPAAEPSPAAPVRQAPPAAEPVRQAPPAAEPVPAAPPAAEPAHVDAEPELVAEVAERGAEDGAGAEVAVDEPWPGYDEMQAADIQDRLVAETPETAAAVSLYEASRKGRGDVLQAASRSMAR